MDDASPTPEPPGPPDPAHRPRRARRAGIAAAVGLLVVAGVVTAVAWPRGHSHPKAQPSSSVAAPPPSPSPTPTAKPTPTVPHDYVAKAAPQRFTMSGPQFTIKAHVCGMDNVRPLDPPGEQHHTVCWVKQDFGVAPGSHSGTTYVLGHAWGQDDLEVLNQASSRATRDVLHVKPQRVGAVPIWPAKSLLGYKITLTTRTGTLTYAVRKSYGVRKSQAADLGPMMDQSVPNRIVLITCAERNHVDYDYNIILEAYLVSSVRSQV